MGRVSDLRMDPRGSIIEIHFDLFLDRYDVFWLTLAARVKLTGGVPVFSGVPQTSVDEILRRHGLVPVETRMLDADKDVLLVKWERA